MLPVARRGQAVLGKEKVILIQLRVDDILRGAAHARSRFRSASHAIRHQDWADMNKSLFSALASRRWRSR